MPGGCPAKDRRPRRRSAGRGRRGDRRSRRPRAKAILGAALLELGHGADAVACLREAVAGTPNGSAYREALARALERIGDTDAALRVLTEGIAMSPGQPTHAQQLPFCCASADEISDQAARLAEQARSSGVADACTFGMKGHALSSLGDHDQAVVAYQEALKLAPEDPYVRHLVVAATAMPSSKRAPEEYIRTVFDGYADRFENHLISLRLRHSGGNSWCLAEPPKDRVRPVPWSRSRPWVRNRPRRTGNR